MDQWINQSIQHMSANQLHVQNRKKVGSHRNITHYNMNNNGHRGHRIIRFSVLSSGATWSLSFIPTDEEIFRNCKTRYGLNVIKSLWTCCGRYKQLLCSVSLNASELVDSNLNIHLNKDDLTVNPMGRDFWPICTVVSQRSPIPWIFTMRRIYSSMKALLSWLP